MASTYYLWDTLADCYLSEHDISGDTQTLYTVAPTAYGRVVSQQTGVGHSWYTYDGTTSTRQLTDANGDVVGGYSFDAWGTAIATQGEPLPSFSWIGEVGYYFTEKLQYYYIRARSFISAVARWTSADPLFVLVVGSPYVYARPLSSTDPSGLLTILPGPSVLGRLQCPTPASASWDFRIDAAHTCSGFIVQKVDYLCRVQKCKPGKRCPKRPYQSSVYWEAWKVPANAAFAGPPRIPGQTDIANMPNPAGKRGFVSQQGEVRFYCDFQDAQNKDLNIIIGKWGAITNRTGKGECQITSGELRRTTTEPGFWKLRPQDGPAFRTFNVNWYCIPGKPGSIPIPEVTATASPA